MDSYYAYTFERAQTASIPRLLRNIRRMPTYGGCDPYTSFLGFNW